MFSYYKYNTQLSAMSMFGLDTKEKVLQSCLSAVEAFQDRYRGMNK